MPGTRLGAASPRQPRGERDGNRRARVARLAWNHLARRRRIRVDASSGRPTRVTALTAAGAHASTAAGVCYSPTLRAVGILAPRVRTRARVAATRSASAASNSGASKLCCRAASHAAVSGPTICPTPNAAVSAATRRVWSCGISSRASRITTMGIGMSMLPVNTVASARPRMLGQTRISVVPAIIATKAPARTERLSMCRRRRGNSRVRTTVAAPYSGQNHSRSAGRCRCSPAMTGRKVAGMT